MSEKKIVGAVEFHSFEGDPDIGTQINEWLNQYPEVIIVDSKYEVISYIENNMLKFATFALVFFHEPPGTPSEVNRATTQRMQLPPGAKMRR
jgi:hypothetical protein